MTTPQTAGARRRLSSAPVRSALALALFSAGIGLAVAQTGVDPALQAAPADGWAAVGGATTGGAAATVDRIYTVSNRGQLVAALGAPGTAPRIVKVVGRIDMSEGVPFISAADQAGRSVIPVPSNTTLIGAGPGAGFVNGWVNINAVSNVIVRNLKIVAPCDVAPVWDPTDGSTGSWNAAYDAISVNASTRVWIDHNTLTDVPVTDDALPIENGKPKQCHDGLLDITRGSDLVTVSYNVLEQHDKAMLVGHSDSNTADTGKLRITFSNNVFSGLTQRTPRVRYGQVHLFNNYFAGAKGVTPYGHSYSVGAGKSGQILSNNNVFAITGAANCAAVVTPIGADAVTAFRDTGSQLNNAALGACPVSTAVGWTTPYSFAPRPTPLVKANALAQAGAGKLSTSISGTGNVGLPSGTLMPANGASFVHTDTRLAIAFDNAPSIGSSGFITVRRLSDGVVVDQLDISTTPSASDTQTVLPRTNLEIDALGLRAMPEGTTFARYVWYRPITVSGNVATIQLRSNKLAFSTAYSVTVDAGVLSGSVNGGAFNGINTWTFTTRAAPLSRTAVTVDDDGSTADFRSLQGALNWLMSNCSTNISTHGCHTVATPKTITLANGQYPGMAVARRLANLTIQGESRDGVVVVAQNFESFNGGSGASTSSAGTALSTSGKTAGHRVLGGGRSVLLVESSDLVTLQNFTLTNSHSRSNAYDNQAEALYFNTSTTAAAGRLVAKQMNFFSEQDTLQLKGYNWIYRSLVAGNVDFIWGGVMASLFEESEIRSVFDPASSSPGYILQARATAGDVGYVFLNSTLTAGNGVSQAYLARSGGTTSSTYVDNIAFINTKMGPHILPVGWCVGTGTSKTGQGTGACSSNPPSYGGTANGGSTDAAGWRESGSMDLSGAPLNVSGRLGAAVVNVGGVPSTVVLAKPLDSTAGLTTRAEIFFKSTIATGAPGGWVPVP